MPLKERTQGYFLLLIHFFARIPFLFAGYGKEEDAWAQVLNARILYETGKYEVSRLPGHPVFELLLSRLYPMSHAYWFYNGISALASALVVYYTYGVMRKLLIPHAFWMSLGLGFIPVFFIAGTYTIDYTLALALIMASFFALLNRHWIWAGLLLGLATGVRISSFGFLLPFLVWLAFNRASLRSLVMLASSALLTSGISFLLPFLTYGWAFLDFHKPPFPSIANVLYKISLGIWGIPLLFFVLMLVWKGRYKWISAFGTHRALMLTLLLVTGMQLAVFLRLPFKSEFFIPALPFLAMTLALGIQAKQARAFVLFALLSCFLMGFDYNQSHRGSPSSALSQSFKAGGKSIAFHPFKGPVLLDQSKRRQKSAFVNQVVEWSRQQAYPYYMISGWYWPELMLKLPGDAARNFDYYATVEELLEASAEGKELYYLPEIQEANAKVYAHYLADSLASEWKPLP